MKLRKRKAIKNKIKELIADGWDSKNATKIAKKKPKRNRHVNN